MKLPYTPILALYTLALSPALWSADNSSGSTKVKATVIFPAKLPSFAGQTLELRLYGYDPFLADASADLIEKVEKPKFSHTQGKKTKLEIEIGAKGKVQPRRNYYLTTYVLNGKTRTHIGEKDGKKGLCNVISNGQPREVKVIVRPVG